MSEPPGPRRWWLRAAVAVAKRPDLWVTALSQARALSVRRWWRTWPPVPRPARQWLEFRMETAYGGTGEAVPERADIVTFVGWSATMGRWRRR